MKFKKNQYIYYIDKEGNHWPRKIIEIKNKIKIYINHLKGNKIIWVKSSNLEEQK
jgi:hypothetical protein